MGQTSIDQKWTSSVTRTGTGQSAPLKIPSWVNELSAFLLPNGTTCGLEYTGSDEADIDGASASWVAWDAGQVTSNTARSAVGPITGVRINQTVGAGTSTLQLVGQRRLP